MKGTAAARAAAEWRERLLSFEENKLWRQWRDPLALRSLLQLLHAILDGAPKNLLQEFDQFDEKTLADNARRLMRRRDPRELMTVAKTDGEALLRAAELLRSLDELLSEGAETISDEVPECWLTVDREAHVVPVRRPVMKEGGPRTNQSFSRRGILHHRIVPVRVGDTDVVIEAHPDLTLGSERLSRTFGAALFVGFQLDYETVGRSKFVVTSVDCTGGIAEAVDRQCNAAHSGECDTVIWPELTLPAERVRQIAGRFGSLPLNGRNPPIVLAGSWHNADGQRYINRAPVLDGRGKLLLEFGKSRRFTFNGLTEDVEVHGSIHILVTDCELIAFAICKDFCDKAKAVPVTGLDVDLVLVPSMGEPGTMTAHRGAADDMRVLFGTRTAVVQQTYPVPDALGSPGYLLRVPAFPRQIELADLACSREFTIFQRE